MADALRLVEPDTADLADTDHVHRTRQEVEHLQEEEDMSTTTCWKEVRWVGCVALNLSQNSVASTKTLRLRC